MNLLKIFLIIFLSIFILSGCKDNNPVDGGNPPIGDKPFYPSIDGYPVWSPNGAYIIYNHYGITQIDVGGSYYINPDSAGLWLINTDGTNPHLILKGGVFNASWSPDGKWIAFEAGTQIYKAPFLSNSMDTTQIIELTFEGRNFFPAWSPDGRWIAYNKSLSDSHGLAGVWTIHNNGDSSRFLFGGSYPAWNPDGSLLIGVIGTTPTSIWTKFVVYNYNYSILVDTFQAVMGNINSSPKYSPDGERIAFTSQPEGGSPQIWIINSDGTNLQQLTTDGGMQPTWSPDGLNIAYLGWTDKNFDPQHNGTIYIMNAGGSNKHQLTNGPKPN